MTVFKIATDFSQFLVGRTKQDSATSGENLREILVPLLREGPLVVDLDGTMGYSSAFLQGAFEDLSREAPVEGLRFISERDPSLVEEILSYL